MSVEELLAEQLVAWEAERAQRLELGDNLDTAREVEHFAYFPARADAKAAAFELDELGFATSLRLRWRGESLVLAVRTEPLTDETVRATLNEILPAVLAHNGQYDGSGAQIAL